MLGRLHAAGGFWERALAEHRRAAQLDPSSADPYIQMAYALAYLGRIPEAGASFLRAVTLQPNSYRSRYGLALYYYDLRMLEDAEREWDKAAQLTPTQWNAKLNIALIRIESGRSNEAKAILEEVPPAARSTYWHGLAGDIHSAGHHWAEATDSYLAAIRAGGVDFPLWASLARAYEAAGSRHDAESSLRRGLDQALNAIPVSPRESQRLAWAAYFHAALGEKAAATQRASECLLVAQSPMTRVREPLVLAYDLVGDRASAARLIDEAPDRVRSYLANLEKLTPGLRRDLAIRNTKR